MCRPFAVTLKYGAQIFRMQFLSHRGEALVLLLSVSVLIREILSRLQGQQVPFRINAVRKEPAYKLQAKMHGVNLLYLAN